MLILSTKYIIIPFHSIQDLIKGFKLYFNHGDKQFPPFHCSLFNFKSILPAFLTFQQISKCLVPGVIRVAAV